MEGKCLLWRLWTSSWGTCTVHQLILTVCADLTACLQGHHAAGLSVTAHNLQSPFSLHNSGSVQFIFLPTTNPCLAPQSIYNVDSITSFKKKI